MAFYSAICFVDVLYYKNAYLNEVSSVISYILDFIIPQNPSAFYSVINTTVDIYFLFYNEQIYNRYK